jgi:hypothetical protein
MLSTAYIKDKGYTMANNLITLAEYKTYSGILSTNQDAAITSVIPKVSDLVKSICRRTFTDYVNDTKTETKRSLTNNRFLARETPVLSVNSVEFSNDFGQTYTTLTNFIDYVVDVDSDAVEIISYPYVDYEKVNAFRFTYNAGYETVPQDLKMAVMDLTQYYLRNDSAVHSTKAVSPNTMQIEYVNSTNLPAHIKRVLDLYTASYD